MKEDMLKTKRVFLIKQNNVFWLKIIKIETKNFCYSKLKIYYLRSITQLSQY
jgi:hypothetical protein